MLLELLLAAYFISLFAVGVLLTIFTLSFLAYLKDYYKKEPFRFITLVYSFIDYVKEKNNKNDLE
jgi:hypothetical protein